MLFNLKIAPRDIQMAFLVKINLSVNATVTHSVMPYFLMLFLKSGLLKATVTEQQESPIGL